MKITDRFTAVCAALVVFLALPAVADGSSYSRSKSNVEGNVVAVGAASAGVAQGSSYVTTRPKWNGKVKVVDATTGAALNGAYVVGRNIPMGSTSFGLHIVNRDDGRVYDKTDAMGMGKAMVGPLGTLVIWMPGYQPVHNLENLQAAAGISSPDADGIVTVKLVPAVSAEDKAKAGKDAVAWLEPKRRAPFIHIGRKANRSVEYRAEVRAALVKAGAISE